MSRRTRKGGKSPSGGETSVANGEKTTKLVKQSLFQTKHAIIVPIKSCLDKRVLHKTFAMTYKLFVYHICLFHVFYFISEMHQRPYYADYSHYRLFVHNVVTSKYFDLAIAGVIGLNVVTMAIEYYRMPPALQYALKIFNYFFTAVFILEALMKLVALGIKIYMKDKWNQLDVGIVILSIVGIVLEELETNIIPINPTIMRVMRVLRIARVLKLLKMAKGIRALLDTVMQALPQVGNLGLLFFLLFFIFAALGVELFGRLECSDEIPCQGKLYRTL